MNSDLYLVSENLTPLKRRAIDQLNSVVQPPPGYAEFMATLGYGTYCDFVTVWRPTDILSQRHALRRASGIYSTWYDPVPDIDFETIVPIGLTVDGDYLVVAPEEPNRIIGLPRHDDCFYFLPDGFDDLLNWKRATDNGREYVSPPPFRYFQPVENQAHVRLFTKGSINRQDVVKVLTNALSSAELRHIDEDSVSLIFSRAIDGRIQLTGGTHDPRVGIGFSFDKQHREAVEEVVRTLEEMGFFVV